MCVCVCVCVGEREREKETLLKRIRVKKHPKAEKLTVNIRMINDRKGNVEKEQVTAEERSEPKRRESGDLEGKKEVFSKVGFCSSQSAPQWLARHRHTPARKREKAREREREREGGRDGGREGGGAPEITQDTLQGPVSLCL